MRFIRFSYRPSALLGCVLVACVAVLTSPGSAGGLLQGTGKWDLELVKAYFKNPFSGGLGLDISLPPGDYPNRQMLSRVNPEFAKRVDVLIAVWLAAGGKPIGIVPETGGLRTAQVQLNLYKQCRRPPPGGTQSAAVSTWVLDYRGAHNEPAKGLSSYDHFVKSDSCPDGKPIEWAPVSWHNVGLAVDFGEYNASRKYISNDDSFLRTVWWLKVQSAMEKLGMIDGVSVEDPRHVDWHPYLERPTDKGAAWNSGYAWKLPSTIYEWHPSSTPGVGLLYVYDLESDGNWITIKDSRAIQTFIDKSWEGRWETYNPAVKIGLAYIPTIDCCPKDYARRYKTVSNVEIKSYSNHAGMEEWRDTTGSPELYPGSSETDLQKVADVQIGEARSERFAECQYMLLPSEVSWPCRPESATYESEYFTKTKPFMVVHAASYYNVVFHLVTANPITATIRAHSDWHRDRNPADWEREETIDRFGEIVFPFGWNRDQGIVGQLIFGGANMPGSSDTGIDLIKPTEKRGTAVISSELPAGAMDKTEPPNWPF